MEYSLLYPDNSERKYKTLTDAEVADLCANATIVGVENDNQKGTNLLSALGLDIEDFFDFRFIQEIFFDLSPRISMKYQQKESA